MSRRRNSQTSCSSQSNSLSLLSTGMNRGRSRRNRNGPRVRPSYSRADDEQMEDLLCFFCRDPYPSLVVRTDIGDKVGRSEKQIGYWFDNHRRKLRKQLRDGERITEFEKFGVSHERILELLLRGAPCSVRRSSQCEVVSNQHISYQPEWSTFPNSSCLSHFSPGFIGPFHHFSLFDMDPRPIETRKRSFSSISTSNEPPYSHTFDRNQGPVQRLHPGNGEETIPKKKHCPSSEGEVANVLLQLVQPTSRQSLESSSLPLNDVTSSFTSGNTFRSSSQEDISQLISSNVSKCSTRAELPIRNSVHLEEKIDGTPIPRVTDTYNGLSPYILAGFPSSQPACDSILPRNARIRMKDVNYSASPQIFPLWNSSVRSFGEFSLQNALPHTQSFGQVQPSQGFIPFVLNSPQLNGRKDIANYPSQVNTMVLQAPNNCNLTSGNILCCPLIPLSRPLPEQASHRIPVFSSIIEERNPSSSRMKPARSCLQSSMGASHPSSTTLPSITEFLSACSTMAH